MRFILKVIRNGLILSGLFFFSIFAGQNDIDFMSLKPVLIFFGTYCLTEFARYYHLSPEVKKSKITTFIF